MMRITSTCATTLLTVLLLCLTTLDCAAAEEREAAKIDAIFASLTDAKSPGIAVLIRKNGRSIFQRGYGVRELRTLSRIDERTNFRLASFTKQFTAMITMLLVRDGKLRYDETLLNLFPDFPVYGQRITIRQLLTHTSGLPDYEDLMDEVEKRKGPIWTDQHQIQDAEVLDLLKGQTSGKFAPGTNWAYSNSGYVLLGLIDAKVSGKPFDQVLRERIFEPLHMTETLAYVRGKNVVPNRAYGYEKLGSKFIEADQSATSATLGDGGIYSNLLDLAKWDAALETHRLLSEDKMGAALTPVKLSDGSEPHWPEEPGEDNLNPGAPVSYGFGWFLDSYKGRARMWHSGTTSGFRTAIERFRDERLTVIVLCNREDLDANKLALQASDSVSRQ